MAALSEAGGLSPPRPTLRHAQLSVVRGQELAAGRAAAEAAGVRREEADVGGGAARLPRRGAGLSPALEI